VYKAIARKRWPRIICHPGQALPEKAGQALPEKAGQARIIAPGVALLPPKQRLPSVYGPYEESNMKKLLKVCALVVALLIAATLFARYWFLSWDEIAPPDLPGVSESGVLSHEGHDRQWVAYVPASKGDKPPLLLFFRGSGSDGAMARSGTFFSFDILAEQKGFIAVYPTGFERHWNGCRKAATYTANLQNIDDVSYIRLLVADMKAPPQAKLFPC
jgi:hypothetical protein